MRLIAGGDRSVSNTPINVPAELRAEYEIKVWPRFGSWLESPDGEAKLITELPRQISAKEAIECPDQHRVWELCGLYYRNLGRFHGALAVFHSLYDHMLRFQAESGRRTHKGMPLCWASDCYDFVGCPVLARRYLMLTTCEDAIRDSGSIDVNTSGVYIRWVMKYGLGDNELSRYAAEIWKLHQDNPRETLFPEWIVQQLDHLWMAGYPSPREAGLYVVTRQYAAHLLSTLGTDAGKSLEMLAHYLLSAIPGCRAYRRQRSYSTDYDVVCALEGADLDFRSDLGRYFICECKDWESPADFTAFAKFCRVLDAAKCRFGILFSKSGISGQGSTTNAEREQLKVFHDRGLVIIVISESDLRHLAGGANLIALLRERYESVRLDLRATIRAHST
jgi:hypothetical protein